MRALLNLVCMGAMCAYRMISCFLGRPFTSDLSRRSRNGRSSECSFLTTMSRCSSAEDALKSNQLSKSVRLPNTSGRMKLSRLHSSFRLFCSGVPVSSSLFCVSSELSSLNRRQSLFFRRWPSSTTMYFQLKRRRKLTSQMAISYDVTMIGKVGPSLIVCMSSPPDLRLPAPKETSLSPHSSALMSMRSSLVPWKSVTLNVGAKRLISFTQLDTVLSGPMMR
mmetsp:Transcript_10068/g.31542  ORF Transcript_10068/g.31542 Transcript_10068/m.31542 type:complete len:222 (+) Transcript_10068:1089-1754(+)